MRVAQISNPVHIHILSGEVRARTERPDDLYTWVLFLVFLELGFEHSKVKASVLRNLYELDESPVGLAPRQNVAMMLEFGEEHNHGGSVLVLY